ncbi:MULTISPECIES: PTS sugar transporter subunit IIB [Gracilibacillus]|uniref:PTS sugar transporter subunit IIB n=1 Tax=Gracilibacillus dipsosauri TaxID=178340 RepID=A0A317L303_9BACI|nr:PTS sugar transporter subunit IIB [Gracilibacillus dipsosauri]PWU70015.1 PTS sugar transporter subunit IIB [Gracilibacillus dipsosauri]
MKILLICSAGMSTSILVDKMKKAAEDKGISAEINAVAESELQNHLDGLDVVLIGPQVRYLEKSIKEKVEPLGIQCEVIDQIAYGMMKGDQVLEQAIKLADKK